MKQAIMGQAIMGLVLALGLGMQPALAESQDAGQKPGTAHEPETIHAPTNRVGEMVPTMTGPEQDAAKRSKDTGEKSEKMHAPINRVGEEVPPMTDGESGK